MKTLFLTAAMIAALGAGAAAQAQGSPPVGGADAKGNAPLKHRHTINDGSAKPGANSFTEGQARQHILNSGYTDVTGLTKGQDGVWRGQATHNGASVQVAMDFKGNVTEASGGGGAVAPGAASQGGSGMGGPGMAGSAAGASAAATGGSGEGAGPAHHPRHHKRRHHHRHGACANPGPNGAACSGVATLQNGVSDKETHAMQSGAHP